MEALCVSGFVLYFEADKNAEGFSRLSDSNFKVKDKLLDCFDNLINIMLIYSSYFQLRFVIT